MTVTPSPQSVGPLGPKRVLVLKSAVERLILAADMYGVAHLDSDDMDDDAVELQDATEGMKDALAAAPAPSSLAGGKVHEAVALEVRMAMQDEMMASDANGGRVLQRIERANRAADAILAALSPEAPAREGSAVDRVMSVLNHWFDGTARVDRNSEMVAQLAALVTPRHEAPADDGPVFHMNLLSHEDNEAWLESARRVAAKHEAPAEGAGEQERLADAYIAGALSVHEYWTENPGEAPSGDPEFDEAAGDYAYSTLADLRARSSAPEAREEALGNAVIPQIPEAIGRAVLAVAQAEGIAA